MLTKILDYRISIRQLVAIGLVLGVPYLIIGIFWMAYNSSHLAGLEGLDYLFSWIGEVIAWPPLVISDITLK